MKLPGFVTPNFITVMRLLVVLAEQQVLQAHLLLMLAVVVAQQEVVQVAERLVQAVVVWAAAQQFQVVERV
jgi:hypothetical protein